MDLIANMKLNLPKMLLSGDMLATVSKLQLQFSYKKYVALAGEQAGSRLQNSIFSNQFSIFPVYSLTRASLQSKTSFSIFIGNRLGEQSYSHWELLE